MFRRASSNAAAVARAFGFAQRALLALLSVLTALTILRAADRASIAWAALAVVTALRPTAGLLILAGLVPLGGALSSLFGSGLWTEALVLAFLAAAAARGAVTRRAVAIIPGPAALLALAVVSSCAIQLALRRVRMGPSPFLEEMAQLLSGHYFSMIPALGSLTAAALFLEGVALFVAVMAIVRVSPETLSGLTRMMIAGAAGAAALNVSRLLTASVATGAGWSAILRLAQVTRINVQFGDVNAAGSYFAMLLCLAVGVTVSAATRGARALGGLCALVIALALWLTSSRAAIFALLAAGAAATVIGLVGRRRDGRATPRVLGGLGVVAAALLVVAFLPNRLIGGNVAAAAGIRRDMAVVSVRLLATEPVFGIGIGQFYDQSGSEMQRLPVGQVYLRQNAHNNFLQILAELGAIGFGCFALVVWLVLQGLWSADREHMETSVPIRAAAAALGTFLVSALFGHPLLTPECAYAFWMLAGAAAAFAPPPAARRWTRSLAVAASALLLVSTPVRAVAAVRNADLDHLGYGLSQWQPEEDGQRYRIANGTATIFIPGDAAVVRVPLRTSGDSTTAVPVSVRLHGSLVDRLQIRGASWTWYKFAVPEHERSRFVPLELEVDANHREALHVGKVLVVQRRAR